MNQSKHFGLVGGLGVGATVLYYQGIAAACAERNIVPRLTMAHANAPTCKLTRSKTWQPILRVS
jgi:aspartate/glutamate racemase